MDILRNQLIAYLAFPVTFLPRNCHVYTCLPKIPIIPFFTSRFAPVFPIPIPLNTYTEIPFFDRCLRNPTCFNGAVPVKAQKWRRCLRPRPTRWRCFNGAVSVKTRKSSFKKIFILFDEELQWGRVGEDTEIGV